MTLLHSLSSSWTWWPSSLMTSAGTPRAAMRSSKSSTSSVAGWWHRTEHVGHDLRLVGVCGPGSLVELLDVREVERALRARPLRVAAHVEVHLPEDAQLRRDDGVGLEDPPATEVGAQPLEDDDVRRDDEERLGVVVATLGDGVEVLPGDGERHDLRLAAARRHLDGVPSEVVVLQDVDARHLGEALDEIPMAPDLLDLVEPDERLDRFALRVVVLEGLAVGTPVIRREPVVEERLGRVRRALVLLLAPLLDGLADLRDARRRRDPRLEQVFLLALRLARVLRATASHLHRHRLRRVVAEDVDDLDDDGVLARLRVLVLGRRGRGPGTSLVR